MSDAERRAILSQVAEGNLTPDEAAERLSSLDRQTESSDQAGGDRPSSKTAAGGERGLPPGAPALRVRVVGSVRMVEIIGDPGVKEASVEGPHDARREGDLLIIEGEGPDVAWSQPGWRWNWNWGASDDEDSEPGGPKDRRARYRADYGSGGSPGGRTRSRVTIAGFPGAAALAEGFSGARRRNPALKVRVNPNLPLEAGIKAGAMSIRGVSAPMTLEAEAASLQIKDFSAPIDAKVNAAKFEATGRLDEGESRIECNAGKVDLRLDSGSSVKITARAELSRVSLPGGESRSGGLLGSEHEALVGGGAAILSMEVNVGSATVAVADGENG